jgi:spore maturation protein CgeB
MKIVVLGLSITSSWGNGHATTYRGLLRELAANGHIILFLERDVPWYAENRDLPHPPYCSTRLYESVEELQRRHESDVAGADLVIVGSYVPDGVVIGEWVTRTARGTTAFYDIDTPITLAKLAGGDCDYLSPSLVRRYDLYLSFTGGPTLRRIERDYGSPMARALYCSFDPQQYFPDAQPLRWDLGYLGTYSDDRQPSVDALLVQPARSWREGRFIVAGAQYPPELTWPANVERVSHLPPQQHRVFYNAQRFTLNVTRSEMVRAGWSPSVRLFEAAACGTPLISDWWDGLDSLFAPGHEIVIAENTDDVVRCLRDIPEEERRDLGLRARQRVLAEHTAAHRARELEAHAVAAQALSSRA